uniref:Uncharacterized protein n=1 Tax=Anguilla anguilla TaxID=7936 RepID=A0A0E9UBP1_ANGAN
MLISYSKVHFSHRNSLSVGNRQTNGKAIHCVHEWHR